MTRSVLAGVLAVSTTACVVVSTDPGPTRTRTEEVAIGAANEVRVDVEMGSGELSIEGGAGKKLVETTFRYSEGLGGPEVHYDVARSQGRLTIESPKSVFNSGHTTNEWKLRFGNAAPLDFDIQVGAGQSTVDLSGLPVRRVEIQMGAGRLNLNLAGHYTSDVYVTVQGGVGQALISLPSDVGAIADVLGGIGSIQTAGMRRRGGFYVNRAFEEDKPAIRLKVRGGIGEIRFSVTE